MKLGAYTPGFVVSYDPATKLARVRIPGVTDGASVFPQAMLCFPIGDKGEHTDIRILPDDRVWLDFVNGDPRFPIIQGFRPKETDNAVAWRRIHHDNVDIAADAGQMQLSASTAVAMVAGQSVTITGGTTVTISADGANVFVRAPAGSVFVEAPNITLFGNVSIDGAMAVSGPISFSGGINGTGTAFINGKAWGDTHRHKNTKPGSAAEFSGPVA